MSGHTPGPWEVEEQTIRLPGFDTPLIGYTVTAQGDDGLRVTIAEIHPKSYPVAVREENARLIAAAPDLLEAAKAVDAGIERASAEEGVFPENLDLDTYKAFSDLVAAIAKAEGITVEEPPRKLR